MNAPRLASCLYDALTMEDGADVLDAIGEITRSAMAISKTWGAVNIVTITDGDGREITITVQ